MMTTKEIGRMTMREFNKNYSHYKSIFDLELMMHANKTTYEKLDEQQYENELWFK